MRTPRRWGPLGGVALLAILVTPGIPASVSWRPLRPPVRRAVPTRPWIPIESPADLSSLPDTVVTGLSPEDRDREFRALQASLRRYPSRPSTHLRLGEIYFFAGNDLAARHHLGLYLESGPAGPDSLRAAILHARALVRLDRVWDALVALELLVRQPAAPAGASHDLAILLQRDRRQADAVAAEMRAVERSGGDPRYARAAAYRWKEEGNQVEALRLFKVVCASGRAEAEDHFQSGFLTHRLGDAAEAGPAYEAALALDPDHPEAHYNLGLVLAEHGDHDGAARHFREVIRLRPTYEPTYFELGIELLRAGRKIEAARAFRDYVRIGTDGIAVLEAAGILNELAPELPDSMTAAPTPGPVGAVAEPSTGATP